MVAQGYEHADFVFLRLCSILANRPVPIRHQRQPTGWELTMKHHLLLPLVFLLLASGGGAVWAQQIYRCAGVGGGAPEYINNVKDAQSRSCKLVSGGNVTVVQGSPLSKAPPRAAASGGSSSPRPLASSRKTSGSNK